MQDPNERKKHGIAIVLALIAGAFFAFLVQWAGSWS